MEDQNLSKDDTFDDDESFDGDGDDGDQKFYEENFACALRLIDHNANLDEVLAAKTIGDALQILVPNMPGLPTKTRGKYLKRRHLNPAEKEMLMKYQNRDNARRTRKRKKLYDYFLKKLLAEVEDVLHPSLVNNEKMPHETNSSTLTTPPPITNDDRLESAKKFLRLRASNRPGAEDWRSVCRADITFSMPGIFRGYRECRGIDQMVEECAFRNSSIEKVILHKGGGGGRTTGLIDFEIAPEDTILGATGDQLSFRYELRVFEAPLLPSGGLSGQSYWTGLWCTQVYCKMSFSGDGLIYSVREQMDVTEIIQQTKAYLGRVDADPTYSGSSLGTYGIPSVKSSSSMSVDGNP